MERLNRIVARHQLVVARVGNERPQQYSISGELPKAIMMFGFRFALVNGGRKSMACTCVSASTHLHRISTSSYSSSTHCSASKNCKT